MCSILLAWRLFDDAPLVIASNRDELRTRQSEPPLRLTQSPPLYGGRDRLAGGTWLAVDPRGRFCAVTNRYLPGVLMGRDPALKSRGKIATQVLATDDDQAAIAVMRGLNSADFNAVNVVYASATTAHWVALDNSGTQSFDLQPGVHAVTAVGCDVDSDIKCSRLLEGAQTAADKASGPDALLESWHQLMISHAEVDGTPQSAVCIHAPEYGTVSGATVVVRNGSVDFAHAEGFPCQVSYVPVSLT